MNENQTSSTNLSFDDIGISVHKNLSQEVIMISEDRLKLKLMEYENSRKKIYDWISPLAISITLIVTLITADFKSALFLSGDVWHAIFVLLTIAAFIWFIASIYNATHNCKITIESVIKEIKQEKIIH